jgi:RNA-directed DNA polymerase
LGNLLTPNDSVREFQRKLYLKSKKDKSCRFYSLFDKVYREDVVKEAWKRVKANKGAPGIDRKTIEEISENQEVFLEEIRRELKAGTYEPKAARRVWIPKRDGKKRPLGIPTIKDRVIQTAVKIVIEPIFEADFKTHSYGFRPKRNCWQAIQEIKKYLSWGLVNVVETDIEDFFNRIPHKRLLSMVGAKIADPNILRLINKWLKCGVMEESGLKRTDTGTPQGGVISPLLANIYLNELDKWWEEKYRLNGNVQIIRYADDLVVLTKRDPEKYMEILRGKLGELELNMKETKTRLLRADEGDFDFLGFNIRMILNRKKTKKFPFILPSKRAVQGVKSRIKEITKPAPIKDRDIMKEINPVLIGWMNYFRYANAAETFVKVHRYTMDSVRKFIRRNQKENGYGRNIITDKIVTETLGLVKPLKIEYLTS